MLDQQDIKQIGNIVEQKVDTMGKGLEERLGVVIEEKVNVMGKGLEERLGAIVEEKIDQAIERKIIPRVGIEFGRVIEQNLMPVLEDMDERLKKVERDMVTKDYLDDKLAGLRGDLVAIDRKQDKKVNFMIESLDSNEILPDSDIKLLRQMEVFPSPPRP